MVNGKDYLKAPHLVERFTKQEAADLIRCVRDPIFFCEKFVKIQHPIHGSLPFELYDFQRDMINNYANHQYNISLTARQMGKCVGGDTIIELQNSDGDEYNMAIEHFYLWQQFIQWMNDEEI